MSAEIDHVILTRYNLPSLGVESYIRAQEGWLRTRTELFEKYCVPSVAAQTNTNFRWVVYFDPESPDWLKERISEHQAAGIFLPIFRPSVSSAELVGDLREVTGAGGSELITTNLDNDDGLAIDFVERLQAAAPRAPRSALYLSRGLIKSPQGLYLRVDRFNAFCSVREPWDEPSTCWVDWHDLLRKRMPVLEISGAPSWLQVVHGTNVSNRVRGSLTTPTPYRDRFPGLLDDVPVPSRVDIARDAMLSQPLRGTRELARSIAKRAALAILGKDGLDRAKNLLASWRRG